MRLYQVINEDGENVALLNVVRDSLTNDQAEALIRKAGEFPEEEDGELFLEENGIERVFVEEIYV